MLNRRRISRLKKWCVGVAGIGVAFQAGTCQIPINADQSVVDALNQLSSVTANLAFQQFAIFVSDTFFFLLDNAIIRYRGS